MKIINVFANIKNCSNVFDEYEINLQKFNLEIDTI